VKRAADLSQFGNFCGNHRNCWRVSSVREGPADREAGKKGRLTFAIINDAAALRAAWFRSDGFEVSGMLAR
jgi:hypothetical protein